MIKHLGEILNAFIMYKCHNFVRNIVIIASSCKKPKKYKGYERNVFPRPFLAKFANLESVLVASFLLFIFSVNQIGIADAQNL